MTWVRSMGARTFIAGMALAGTILFALAFAHWQTSDPVKFVCYLIAALLASSLKVGLPGIEGTLSVNFLFTLLGILELTLPETLAIGLANTLAQSFWKPARRIKLIQLVFNLSQVAISSAVAYGAYQFVVLHILRKPGPLALLVAAIVHFGCNTAAASTIIGLTEEKPITKVWGESLLWLFPYYMLGSNPGLTQQALSELLGVFPSQLVRFLDSLEEQQLIERRDTPGDRRSYRLHLTRKGRSVLARIGELTQELERDFFAALSVAENRLLQELLSRVVAQRNITPGVHPAYKQL